MDRPFVSEEGRERRSAKVTDSRERESEWRARSFIHASIGSTIWVEEIGNLNDT